MARKKALRKRQMVSFPLNVGDSTRTIEEIVEKLSIEYAAPIVPTYCAVQAAPERSTGQNVYVVFGAPMTAGTPAQAVLSEIQRLGDELFENLRQGIDLGKGEEH